MRYMIMVKATKDTEAGIMPEGKDLERLVGAMATYHEELAKAGVLVDGSGLHPSSRGWRIRYSGGNRTVIDGPFAETKELVAGYTVIRVKSRQEALEWTKRFPNPAGEGKEAEIEVREFHEAEDFLPEDAVERFRKIGIGTEQ
ncbi:MAG: YciI family protein [Nitrospirota bacterium]